MIGDELGPGPERSPWVRVTIASTLVVGLVVAWFLIQHRGVGDLLEVGTPAPAFTLTTMSGEKVSLDDYQGKTLLLHFWATYCGPCRREVGALNHVYRQLGPTDAVLAIDSGGEGERVIKAFMKEEAVEYPVAIGTTEVADDYQVNALPITYIVGPDGKIRSRDIGQSSRWGMTTRMGCAKE